MSCTELTWAYTKECAIDLPFYICDLCNCFSFYFFAQVAMGQGQADIALQLLHDCGRNGEWLCLKNLHLVTAWLPTLEKVCY